MRVAVASEGLDVSPYLKHCNSFTIYTIDRGIITECQNMPNPGLTINGLAQLFQELDITVLIAGCVDRGVADILHASEIELVAGVIGTARGATESFLAQTLIATDESCDYDDENTEATRFDLATF